jgi:hypothetical protein
MGLRTPGVVAIVCLAGMLGGCGGGARTIHTYKLLVDVNGSHDRGAEALYVTVASPVRIPTKLLTRHGTIVDEVPAVQACSYTETVPEMQGRAAFLSGKELTLTVYGTSHLVPLLCHAKNYFVP